jgi:hypothetical protein
VPESGPDLLTLVARICHDAIERYEEVNVRAQRSVPPGWVEAGGMTLDDRTKRRLTLLSVGWAVVCLILVCAIGGAVRTVSFVIQPEEFESVTTGALLLGALGVLAALAAAAVLTIIAHEAVHGAVMWWLTGSRPRFGFRGWYAYTTTPGWYFTRGAFLVVALAPAVLLTAASLALYAVLPIIPALVALVVAFSNLLGSIGDLYLSWLVLRRPAGTLVEDRDDGIAWYQPQPTATAPA